MHKGQPIKFRTRRSYDVPGHAHYLTFSCWRGQRFLAAERGCLWLLEAIGAARRVHPFDLWAWVIMPEHVHMLLPADGVSISGILKSVKQPVAKRAVEWVRRNSPEWLPQILDAQPPASILRASAMTFARQRAVNLPLRLFAMPGISLPKSPATPAMALTKLALSSPAMLIR